MNALSPIYPSHHWSESKLAEILTYFSEKEFKGFSHLAAQICGTEIAALSIVSRDRQYFRAAVGLDWAELPLENSFCAQVIAQGTPFILPDTRLDRRFSHNPLAMAEPPIRFYAGVPLAKSGEPAFGTLCVMDRVPRQLTVNQVTSLGLLANQVMERFELLCQLRSPLPVKGTSASLQLPDRERQLAILTHASIQLNTVLEIPSVMRSLIAAAMELVGAAAGTYGLIQQAKMVFTEYCSLNTIQPIQVAFQDQEGVPGWVMHSRQPYVSNDTAHDLHVLRHLRETFGFYNLVNIPIFTRHGELIGCFELHNKLGHLPFNRQDVEILQGLAATAAVALENAQMIAERDQVERSLRESEKKFRYLADASTDLISCHTPAGIYIYTSPACETLLGYASDELLGHSIYEFLHPEDLLEIQTSHASLLGSAQICTLVYRMRHHHGHYIWFEATCRSVQDSEANSVTIHIASRDITRRKQIEEDLRQQAERERLIGSIAQRIRQSLNLEEILNTTVAEVRHFLQSDRVLIYRFKPDWSGIIVVESVGAQWMSVLGTVIYDPCFKENYTEAYRLGRVQRLTNIYTASLSPCHLDLLAQFQVIANLVVPIVQSDQLWGLLIAHQCDAPREWQQIEVEFLQQLATQVAIAIQQSQLYQQVQGLNIDLENEVHQRTAELQQAVDFAAVLKRITDKIRDSLDESQILQTVVRELTHILRVDYCGALLYDATRTTATISYDYTLSELGSAVGQTVRTAESPRVHSRLLKGEYFEYYEAHRDQYFQAPESGDLACPDLFQKFAAKLLYPIFDDQGPIGYLVVIDQVYHWFSKTEIRLVQQVANQCAIAIRQARLYQAAQAQVAELEKLNRLKDDFLSTVSHELRTPVSNMKMALQMLTIAINQERATADTLEQLQTNQARTSRYLQILQDECGREISLINDLLDLQRLEAGTHPLDIQTIDLHIWLPVLIAPFKDRTNSRRQALDLHLQPGLAPYRSDNFSLERILTELIQNACKYTPPGEKIIVSAQQHQALDQSSPGKPDNCPVSQLPDPAQPPTWLVIQVTNTGVAIAPEEQSRIFDKFYRIPSADPWKQGGTGLGLALVKRLVDRLGGTIQVSSTEDQTCFTVELPYL